MERILYLASLIFITTVGFVIGVTLVVFICMKIVDLFDSVGINYGLKASLFLLLVIAFASFITAVVSVVFGGMA